MWTGEKSWICLHVSVTGQDQFGGFKGQSVTEVTSYFVAGFRHRWLPVITVSYLRVWKKTERYRLVTVHIIRRSRGSWFVDAVLLLLQCVVLVSIVTVCCFSLCLRYCNCKLSLRQTVIISVIFLNTFWLWFLCVNVAVCRMVLLISYQQSTCLLHLFGNCFRRIN